MIYRDIINKLIRQNGMTQEEFAKRIGMKGQNSLSMRLKSSHNPGMNDAQHMLRELGYDIVFVPSGLLDRNKALAEVSFVPEFPEKP